MTDSQLEKIHNSLSILLEFVKEKKKSNSFCTTSDITQLRSLVANLEKQKNKIDLDQTIDEKKNKNKRIKQREQQTNVKKSKTSPNQSVSSSLNSSSSTENNNGIETPFSIQNLLNDNDQSNISYIENNFLTITSSTPTSPRDNVHSPQSSSSNSRKYSTPSPIQNSFPLSPTSSCSSPSPIKHLLNFTNSDDYNYCFSSPKTTSPRDNMYSPPPPPPPPPTQNKSFSPNSNSISNYNNNQTDPRYGIGSLLS
ncbi:hypothetical protein CYY_003301 [Polysphondylium violaceum]|uniref:Uncharacterized protein n=1 Tax=Polysphondylium violaceum TaxID=133409 RepID=A0A8J4V615_9MYCE|nr:hypothetical protein CYY_003301 [Polysphondylium violaceum]